MMQVKTKEILISSDPETGDTVRIISMTYKFDRPVKSFSQLRDALECHKYNIDDMRLEINSPYDCTGQEFTTSMRLLDRYIGSNFIVFLTLHKTGFDI